MKLLKDMTEPQLRIALDVMAAKLMRTAELLEIEQPRFVLLLFNDPKVSQYVCNCERADMIHALREAADRLERMEDIPR